MKIIQWINNFKNWRKFRFIFSNFYGYKTYE
nr:MAG TPA: hypothetical protein [Caudoviricetes sp.]